MKAVCKLLLFLSVFAWIGCEENNEPVIDESNLLIGYWINPVVTDTVFTYDRTEGLKKDVYGFGFKSGNLFVERKIPGFCGTPPVSLKDYHGTWERQDSLIDIIVPYWGGTAHYQWKIVSLDNRYLTIAVVKQEYPE